MKSFSRLGLFPGTLKVAPHVERNYEALKWKNLGVVYGFLLFSNGLRP